MKFTFRIASVQLRNAIDSESAPANPTVRVTFEVWNEQGDRVDTLDYHVVDVPLIDSRFPLVVYQLLARQAFIRKLRARALVERQRQLSEQLEGYEFTTVIEGLENE